MFRRFSVGLSGIPCISRLSIRERCSSSWILYWHSASSDLRLSLSFLISSTTFRCAWRSPISFSKSDILSPQKVIDLITSSWLNFMANSSFFNSTMVFWSESMAVELSSASEKLSSEITTELFKVSREPLRQVGHFHGNPWDSISVRSLEARSAHFP